MQEVQEKGQPLCGLPGCEVGAIALCSGCRSVAYCSSVHQSAHWQAHKASCKVFLCKWAIAAAIIH